MMSEERSVPADSPTRMRSDTKPCSLVVLMETAQDLQKYLVSASPPPHHFVEVQIKHQVML